MTSISWLNGRWRKLRLVLTSCLLTLPLGALLLLVACGARNKTQTWQLLDVSRHLPTLQFSLVSGNGRVVNAQDYLGKVVLVYFGYTYCPDVCPETLAKLMKVLNHLGKNAEAVRVLFISVDPKRDYPKDLQAYIRAFDPEHMVGLTGTPKQIEAVAKRYRVAYEEGPKNKDGYYEVMHSSAVYIFDSTGHARLIATGTDSSEKIVHDLQQLLKEPF